MLGVPSLPSLANARRRGLKAESSAARRGLNAPGGRWAGGPSACVLVTAAAAELAELVDECAV